MLHISPGITIYILTITFILGCCLGSFADCAAGRLLSGESVFAGRSHCDHCGHVLGVLDLIPLFSWLLLKGHCRYCRAKLPAEAFFVELVSGIACCMIVYRYDMSVMSLRGILLTVVL
ncbi:prepilin peptidase [Lachnospiraceae bacterium OF11-28]|nr:prepilin peptidase [Lachnospiraceae bacterium OF11-28]